MEVIDINSEFYPDSLKDIKNPPQKLYALGNVELLNSKTFAIIGSRRCTEYGKKQAYRFAYGLSLEGITITSGMALRN